MVLQVVKDHAIGIARGITEPMLTKGARRSTFDECADWTVQSDKVVTFWAAPVEIGGASRGLQMSIIDIAFR